MKSHKSQSVLPRIQSVDPVLRVHEVSKLIGLAKPTIWRMRQQGKFPQPIKLTDQAIGWRRSTVEAWINERETVR